MDEETLMDMAAPTPAAQCKNGAIGSNGGAPLVNGQVLLKANRLASESHEVWCKPWTSFYRVFIGE